MVPVPSLEETWARIHDGDMTVRPSDIAFNRTAGSHSPAAVGNPARLAHSETR